MSNIFPIDFEEKLTMAQDDYILFSDSEDGNKIKKAQYKNLKGEPGTPGTPGKDGEDGAAATITVGSTTTGAAGSSASVTNSGTSSAAVFNFTIPQGAKGEPGEDGADGNDGAAATITVGTTTTLPAGSSATVTNSGTSSAAVLNFGIPKGDAGTGSGDVTGPASSTDGDVALFDGATGKLIKDSGVSLADYQEKLTAGTNIQISASNVISATGGSEIVYATQAEYNALLPGAESDGKHYFIYSTSGGGWQPGVNTVAYYPLDTDFNDASGNSRNLTNSGATITTLNGVSCAYYNGSSYSTYTGATLPRTARTMSVWANGTAINDGVIVDIKKYNQDNTGALATIFYGNSVLVADLSSIDMGLPCQTNTWYYVVATQEGNTVKIYINGNLEGTESNRPDYSTRTPDGWALGSQFNNWHNGALNGYLSNVILEDKVRTAQEIQDYYNQTKANYGIS